MRRARAKSSLHHIKMAHSAIRWVVRITWNLHLSPPIRLRSAPYFLATRPPCLLGLDHWLTLLEATRSGNTNLDALQNNHQLPVLGDTFCDIWCIQNSSIRTIYSATVPGSCSGDLIYDQGKQRWNFSRPMNSFHVRILFKQQCIDGRGSSVSRILYIRLSFFNSYKQLYVMLDSFEWVMELFRSTWHATATYC